MTEKQEAGEKASKKSSEEAPKEKPSKVSTTTLRYSGAADVFHHGEHRFRNGEPVAVPSDVAEELLTTPFEKFEEVKE